jgi:hypothetical protein
MCYFQRIYYIFNVLIFDNKNVQLLASLIENVVFTLLRNLRKRKHT